MKTQFSEKRTDTGMYIHTDSSVRVSTRIPRHVWFSRIDDDSSLSNLVYKIFTSDKKKKNIIYLMCVVGYNKNVTFFLDIISVSI